MKKFILGYKEKSYKESIKHKKLELQVIIFSRHVVSSITCVMKAMGYPNGNFVYLSLLLSREKIM